MRGILLVFSTIAAISMAASGSASASPIYPYCIQSQLDGTDCSYSSYNQCMLSASGRGVECIVNPAVAFAPAYPPSRPQRRRAVRS